MWLNDGPPIHCYRHPPTPCVQHFLKCHPLLYWGLWVGALSMGSCGLPHLRTHQQKFLMLWRVRRVGSTGRPNATLGTPGANGRFWEWWGEVGSSMEWSNHYVWHTDSNYSSIEFWLWLQLKLIELLIEASIEVGWDQCFFRDAYFFVKSHVLYMDW